MKQMLMAVCWVWMAGGAAWAAPGGASSLPEELAAGGWKPGVNQTAYDKLAVLFDEAHGFPISWGDGPEVPRGWRTGRGFWRQEPDQAEAALLAAGDFPDDPAKGPIFGEKYKAVLMGASGRVADYFDVMTPRLAHDVRRNIASCVSRFSPARIDKRDKQGLHFELADKDGADQVEARYELRRSGRYFLVRTKNADGEVGYYYFYGDVTPKNQE